MKPPTRNLPALFEERETKKTEMSGDYNQEIHKLPKSLHLDHVMDVRYAGEDRRGKQVKDERRRIKTELDNPEHLIQ